MYEGSRLHLALALVPQKQGQQRRTHRHYTERRAACCSHWAQKTTHPEFFTEHNAAGGWTKKWKSKCWWNLVFLPYNAVGPFEKGKHAFCVCSYTLCHLKGTVAWHYCPVCLTLREYSKQLFIISELVIKLKLCIYFTLKIWLSNSLCRSKWTRKSS